MTARQHPGRPRKPALLRHGADSRHRPTDAMPRSREEILEDLAREEAHLSEAEQMREAVRARLSSLRRSWRIRRRPGRPATRPRAPTSGRPVSARSRPAAGAAKAPRARLPFGQAPARSIPGPLPTVVKGVLAQRPYLEKVSPLSPLLNHVPLGRPYHVEVMGEVAPVAVLRTHQSFPF